MDAQAYIEKQVGAKQAILMALAERIEALGSTLTCKLAWGFPCWTGKERIFSIIAHKSHCNLQLFYGAAIAGESQRIEGKGKALRHVKLRTLSDVDAEIDTIIQAAIAMDTSSPQKVR
ncbi:MAG: DUF1801 domain-containing protein [Pseudomonadota bacterium]